MASPTLKLKSGFEIPAVGLGTYASSSREVEKAVKDAINAGYRHFDCAYFYGNEEEVGAGIRAKIEDGTVKREDLFITSKLWNTYHSYDLVVPSCKTTLRNLGLDYLDLYLMHWPFGWKEGGSLWPTKGGHVSFSDVDYLETWRALEECVNLKLTKYIGLSNFNSEQIDRLLANAKILPVNNQIEAHPYLNQKKIIDFCRMRDITVTAYCPLGRPHGGYGSVLNDSTIVKIARKYEKTPAQIILNYLVSLGISVIPKSVNKKRIEENMNIFDFKLKAEDIAAIDKLDKNYRICGLEENRSHKYYPFNIEY